MKEVRIAIIDCDGVCWFHKETECQIIAKEFDIIKYDVDEFKKQFYHMLKTFNEYFKTKKVTMKQNLELIYREMPILEYYHIPPNEFFKRWNEISVQNCEFNPDIVELLKYLSKKGIKIIVKTDWWREIQLKMLKQYKIIDYFEEIHCCDNSYLKANPTSAAGIIKSGNEEQYVIIGDLPDSDIAFAEHAGIKSIWFNCSGEKNNSPFVPTYEVKSLIEIMNII